MKHVRWIFVVVLLFSLTAFIGKGQPTSGLGVGDKAPDFGWQVPGHEKATRLKALEGNYVLLSFWASYDAPSRASNAMLDHSLPHLPQRVKMVSVSFDEYASIFDETVRQDGIRQAFCFVETSGEASELFDIYHLDKGFKNYLLDKNGVIIAKNVSAEELSGYLE